MTIILHTFPLSSTRPTPSEPRVSYATLTEHTLPHRRSADSLISHHPPAQYKTIDGAPGINDGTGFSKPVYDKYDEINSRGA